MMKCLKPISLILTGLIKVISRVMQLSEETWGKHVIISVKDINFLVTSQILLDLDLGK